MELLMRLAIIFACTAVIVAKPPGPSKPPKAQNAPGSSLQVVCDEPESTSSTRIPPKWFHSILPLVPMWGVFVTKGWEQVAGGELLKHAGNEAVIKLFRYCYNKEIIQQSNPVEWQVIATSFDMMIKEWTKLQPESKPLDHDTWRCAVNNFKPGGLISLKRLCPHLGEQYRYTCRMVDYVMVPFMTQLVQGAVNACGHDRSAMAKHFREYLGIDGLAEIRALCTKQQEFHQTYKRECDKIAGACLWNNLEALVGTSKPEDLAPGNELVYDKK